MSQSRQELNEVKEWLRSYSKLSLTVTELRWQLAEIREQLTNARALVYDDMPHGSGSLNDLSDAMIKLEEQEERIESAIQEANDVKMEIVNALVDLPPALQLILVDRYIYLRKWEDIARAHNLTESVVHYRHNAGLKLLTQTKRVGKR